ncbi:hypothetical protein [Devosia sp.]|uniref:hypothetical protein n=1 Tax=Devosia sp. TaxID=1871048 RepID=UPI002FC5B229
MNKSIALGLALSALLATPTLAAPICSGTFGLSRELYSEADINDYNYSMLRSKGVDVTRVEIWGGCIRAFVIQADGSEQMEFYEPTNFRRVE